MAGSCGQRPCQDKHTCIPEKDNPICRDTGFFLDILLLNFVGENKYTFMLLRLFQIHLYFKL